MLPKAIVFDVDGVLFDTEVMLRRVWEEHSTELGWPQVGENYLAFVGQNRNGIRQKMLEMFGPEFPALDFLIHCANRSQELVEAEGVPMKPGVREILDYLHSVDMPLALATSTNSTRTFRRMEMTGLDRDFPVMITGDMIEHSKPAPDIYLKACEKLGVDPADAIAVEDSANGIRAAHAAGMQVIMIPDLISCSPELEPLLLTCVPSLTALRDYLKTL